MILAVTLNPCIDRTIFVRHLALDKIIQGTRAHAIAGGKGLNVARLARRLGVHADSLTILGGMPGRIVAELSIRQDGIEQIASWTQAPTRDIVTVMEEGTFRQVAFKEPSPTVAPEEKQAFMQLFDSIIEDYDIVTLMGSSPCAATDDVFAWMVQRCKDIGKKAILDSSGDSLANGIDAAPFMVKPNAAEMSRISGEKTGWEAVASCRERGIEVVALTDGPAEAYVQWGERRWIARPPTVKTVNPVASGDSLVAGVAVGLARGLPPEDVIRLGIASGAANAEMWQAASCTRERIEQLVPQVQLEAVP